MRQGGRAPFLDSARWQEVLSVNLDAAYHCVRAVVRGIPIGSRESFERMNRAIALNKMRPVVDRGFPWTVARAAFRTP